MGSSKKATVKISKRALFQRVKRRLMKDDEFLKAARSERARQDVGDYYTVHLERNYILEKDIDLEAKGRELGVLAPYEEVEA